MGKRAKKLDPRTDALAELGHSLRYADRVMGRTHDRLADVTSQIGPIGDACITRAVIGAVAELTVALLGAPVGTGAKPVQGPHRESHVHAAARELGAVAGLRMRWVLVPLSASTCASRWAHELAVRAGLADPTAYATAVSRHVWEWQLEGWRRRT